VARRCASRSLDAPHRDGCWPIGRRARVQVGCARRATPPRRALTASRPPRAEGPLAACRPGGADEIRLICAGRVLADAQTLGDAARALGPAAPGAAGPLTLHLALRPPPAKGGGAAKGAKSAPPRAAAGCCAIS
jgi:hypothetical protein